MHAVNLVLAAAGPPDRFGRRSWLPLTAALASAAQAAVAAKYLFYQMPEVVKAALPQRLHQGGAGKSAMGQDRRIAGWVSGALVVGAFGLLVWAEMRRPLREHREGKVRRNIRNLAVAALSAVTLQALERPIVNPLAKLVQRRRWGLLKRFRLPAWLENVLAVALLDYTLYLWHIMVHRVPFLWRFHQVHHADLDMDTSTALRFHFGEMALSVPYRAAQVALLGVAPRPLSMWQTFLLVSVMFHHSDLRLPLPLERRLSRFFVTPRMHGIHHSIIEDEVNSNWSSGLTLWDWLHGTLRLDVPQSEIDIGVPAYRSPDDVTLPRLVEMPFAEQPPTDRLPSGAKPRRYRRFSVGKRLPG
ncbi:sterol desaturase family protein [Nitratireductor sp. GCM10026969]